MFQNDQDKYYNWIEAHEVSEILNKFEDKCGLKKKEEKLNEQNL